MKRPHRALRLQTRIALLLVSTLLLIGGAAVWLVDLQAREATRQLEHAQAAADTARVQATFLGQTKLLRGLVLSWSNWTDLYEHLQHRNPAFAAEEFTPESLAVSLLDWMVLFDREGTVSDVTEVPQVGGSRPLNDLLQRQPNLRAFLNLMPDQPRLACGAIGDGSRIALVCQAPVLNSEGEGPPSGLLVAGRWLSDDIVKEIQEESGLWFRLEEPPAAAAGGAVARPASQLVGGHGITTLFAQEPATVQLTDAAIQQRWPLLGLNGAVVAEVLMARPRLASDDRSRFDASLVVAAMLGGAALLIVVLVQRMVIRPLATLRQRLGTIVDHKAWERCVQVQRQDEIGDLGRLIDHLLGVVQAQVQDLEQLSQTDTLTGLANRRAFNERLEQMLVRHRRGQAGALVLMDVDHFKRYNDTHGHPAGDRVLQHISACLIQSVRQGVDLPVRLGGEEFALLLENTPGDQACQMAERVRAAIEGLALEHRGLEPGSCVTISLGLTEIRPDDNATTLYHRADEALYQAKSQGRNRVECAPA